MRSGLVLNAGIPDELVYVGPDNIEFNVEEFIHTLEVAFEIRSNLADALRQLPRAEEATDQRLRFLKVEILAFSVAIVATITLSIFGYSIPWLPFGIFLGIMVLHILWRWPYHSDRADSLRNAQHELDDAILTAKEYLARSKKGRRVSATSNG